MLGSAVVDDVKIEVSILVEIKPARCERDRRRADRLDRRRHVFEGLSVAIAEQAILADAGQEQVDLAVGVEIRGGDAEAGLVER